MSEQDSLPTQMLRAFGQGIIAGFKLLDKVFESRPMAVIMVGLCLANLLILAEMTVRWFNGGYISRYSFTLGLFNTLFLLYWWPQVKPLIFKSNQD